MGKWHSNHKKDAPALYLVSQAPITSKDIPLMKTKQEWSLKQQIHYVRQFGESWPLKKAAIVLALISAVAIYAFNVASHEQLKVFLLFVAGICGLLAFAIFAHLPKLKRAARATRTGRHVHGILHLVVDHSDTDNIVIEGTMQEGSAAWKLYFTKPLGWTPQSGEWPCHLVMLADDPVPALAQLNQGLLFPTRKSHKVFSRNA